MEDLNRILSSLEVPTSVLKSGVLQFMLLKVKKINVQSNDGTESLELYSKILQKLWTHLQTGLNEYDNQLLCSTCFYTILSMFEKDNAIVHVMIQTIAEELNKNEDKETKLAITYGMFQSNFLTQKDCQYGCILNDLLNSMISLLIEMAYEYSHLRASVFKVLISLKKVLGTNFQDIVFAKHNLLKLLNLVNHNWENSINGNIKSNKALLQTVISAIDDNMQKDILEEINDFYWNKAKYLTFSEIIEQYKGNLKIFLKTYNIVEGLLYSLSRPGLVSAGADMYYSILKKMQSDNEWADIFLDKITKLLCSSQQAMENFNNYWCFNTFRQFPFVSMMIINSLQKYEDTEQRLLSILNVTKQCNKLNLLEKNWTQSTEVEKNILCGIEHSNPYIRMAAFDIVCVTHGKSWPSEMEYEMILNFLSDNVNSDYKVLRLTMLNSLRSFLSRLQSLHVNNANKKDKDNENLLSFCAKLQEFIVFSLNLNGNYQRKITTIKLASTLMNCFTEYPRKISKKNKHIDYLLYFLCDNKCWNLYNRNLIEKLISMLGDPTDDVRENVSQLLLCHYKYQLKQPVIMDEVVDNALLKIKSKFFYEINCGESIFKLLAYVVLKEVCVDAAMFGTIEDIFNFAYTKLLSEYNSKRDIVESIDKGEQLHSYMRILYVTFDACHKHSYKLVISGDSILSLLEILDGVSNQFVWEEGVPTSSDFSKMNDMVRQIIENSGYTGKNEDGAKITGLEQIVLNCLWLNVKASCELAAALIKYCTIDTSLDVCEKSLFVITKVLETSRHKGAIETAGVALGDAILCLTYLPEENQLSNLPLTFFKQKLKELILDGSNMASVTRRGAGISIMIHRIVSNDMGKDKPIFNYFINTVFETCKKTFNDDLKDTPNTSNDRDLPKAVYIHVLTRIVTDSSLLTDIMHYSAELAEIAFHNLTSPHWQIRNAALQLYGALIPKLIGQKKFSGSEDEATATVACDEFRTHFPNLWTFILEQLNEKDDKDILQSHSNLLPILNILGNMAKRYNLSNDLQAQIEADNKLLRNLSVLLGSPIYAVRRLTAKSIFNIYSINDIYEILIKTEKPNENYLHGCLLLLVYCYTYYEDVKYQNQLELLKKHFCSIIQDRQCSYLCKGLMEHVTDNVYKVTELEEILIPMGLNEPGQFEWINTQIGKCLLKCSSSELPKCVELILNCSEYEKYCKILYTRLDLKIDTDYDVLREITNILLLSPKRMHTSVVWEILYKISCTISIDVNEDINNIIDYVRNESICYKLRFMIPFIARISIKEDDILVVCKVIHKLCITKDFDVDMRMISATANNEIALKLNNYPDEIKIISITTAIILLQDEDEEVRNLSVFFYKNVKNMNTVAHPFMCLRRTLNLEFLSSILNDSKTGIESICQIITESLSTVDIDKDEFNPFANESKNIYQEVEMIKNLIKELKG